MIIPAFNRANLIGETLSSLLKQTLPADEIIVVDDGSTDSTVDAVESEFTAFSRQFSGKGKLPEFKVIRQENAGPGAARNRGFAESKGEFIHFFDSDDIAAPNKHEVQVRALQETGADIAYGPWVKGHILAAETLKEGAESSRQRKAKPRATSEKMKPATSPPSPATWRFEPDGYVFQQRGLPKGDLVKELLTRWSIVPQACLFRRSIVERAGGFPGDLYVGEDQVAFLRFLLAGAAVVHTPQTITFYRLGDEGKLTENPEGARKRAIGWAEYLLRGELMAASSGVRVAQDRRFRARCWSALCQCISLQPPATCQAGRLRKVARISESSLSFRWRALLVRWCGGFRQRLLGDRQDKSFRTGPIKTSQTAFFTCHE